MPKYIFSLLFLFLPLAQIIGQTKEKPAPIVFYDVVDGDSLKMYFNKNDQFCEIACADYMRFIRISPEGLFNSYFEDVSFDGKLKGRGRYINGKREGVFETYYDSGSLQTTGAYRNNIPIGKWWFYHANGLTERQIEFTETDTLLVYVADQNGKSMVENGDGEFKGLVGEKLASTIFAEGNVRNGKPDGKWKSSTMSGTVYCKEEFVNGKLITGIFPSAITNKWYSKQSFINNFILPNYLVSLEMVRTVRCTIEPTNRDPGMVLNMARFNSDFKRFIEGPFLEIMQNERLLADGLNNYSITIGITTESNGNVKELNGLNAWSNQCSDALKRFIEFNARFKQKEMTLYFHLRISNINDVVQYQYGFSPFEKSRF